MLKGHSLHYFLVNPIIAPQFLTKKNIRMQEYLMKAYSTWEQQDQLLLSWLQSSLFAPARLIGYIRLILGNSGNKFTIISMLKPRAGARQLRSKLNLTQKEYCSISEIIFRVKALVDSLFSVGF